MHLTSPARRRPAATIAAATLAMVTAGLASGCTSTPAFQPVAMAVATPSATPSADPVAQAQVTAGLDSFGLALFKQLAADNGNLVLSPQSLAEVLTMILPGAGGASASELESVLGYTGLDPSQAAYAFGAQNQATEQRAVADSDELTENAGVWAQKGLTLRTSYLQTLSGAFGAGVWQPDFSADPVAATKAINQQVSQETKGLVPQLFGPGLITDQTRLVLTDATYFKAPWSSAFDPGSTSAESFTTATGSKSTAEMMSQNAQFGYASGNGWQAVQLPYGGGRLAMDVLLPRSAAPGALAAYRVGLTQGGLTSLADAFKPVQVDLSLPRFTINTTESSLNATLEQLGLRAMFTDTTDLSGMFTSGQPLTVQSVVQQASIQVTEQGTVAAAGSGAGISGAAAPAGPQVVFDADHPFVYLIRDVISGQILFVGQVADPS
jgi:serpin B